MSIQETKTGVKDAVHIASSIIKIKTDNFKKHSMEKVVSRLEKSDSIDKKPERIKPTRIATKSAIKIFYYLMASDGTIQSTEEERFEAIGRELDPNFMVSKESIEKECQAMLGQVTESTGSFEILQKGIDEAIRTSRQTADTFITPKLLVWDMLTVAFSDDAYDETEQRLIEYVVERFAIDETVFLEMENSIQTLTDIQNELVWIKTTNKPYLTIEAMVNELEDRKSTIFESVKALILL